MSRPVDRCTAGQPGLTGSRRLHWRFGAALVVLGLVVASGEVRAEGGGGGRDYEYPAATRQPAARAPVPAYGGRGPQPGIQPVRPGGRKIGRPGRPPGYYPGRGPAAVGVGGILLDQPARRPVYDPYEPEPLPRRVRRPAIIDDDFDLDDPLLERPRRAAPAAASPRRAAPPPARTARPAQPPRVIVPPASERRFVADEILFELAPNAQAEAVLARHRATQIASRRFDLAGTTIIRARLNDGRSARTVLVQMARDARVASAQPNYLYTLQQDLRQQAPADATLVIGRPQTPGAAAPTAIDPPAVPAIAPLASVAPRRELQPQYIVEKLKLGDAHKLARGEQIKVAVIDSGADQAHPELQGVVAGNYDALGGEALPHAHGTAMAAAILAQAQLQGVAPASRLLAARAFSGMAGPASASGTSFHILSALDWAAGEGARVFNLSFAGPQDRLLSRALAGARAKGIVAVAAAGNGGANAAPLYPGADANVIAVTATDADDKPFAGASRGKYIAVAAPGVDVLAAEPQARYAFSSGTSIAAAHVSGLVALLLEKRPDLDLEGVRKLLMESAVDLGAKGRDPIFGAGRVDAPAALARAVPVSVARP